MADHEPSGDAFSREVDSGERFRFGENWRNFLKSLNEARIAEAEHSLLQMLGRESLHGLRFLDIGSGSGIFSLAARRLGAEVHSLDFDPEAVACAEELRHRYFPADTGWRIDRGSALDDDFLASLGRFDIVYSWGVLHHTGDMWKGLENALLPLGYRGALYVAIYNDQGYISNIWKKVKRTYCSGWLGRSTVLAFYVPYTLLMDFIGNGLNPLRTYRYYADYHRDRGMSRWHNLIDWLGGYPFEVAKPEEIFDFYRAKGLNLVRLKTCGGGMGCNEYVFTRVSQNDR